MEESSNPKSEYFVKEEQDRYGVAEDRDATIQGNLEILGFDDVI